jgi:hypothetical protein
MNNNVKVYFKSSSFDLWDASTYMDNVSFDGVGKNHIWSMYQHVKEESEIVIKQGATSIKIKKTEDLLKWLIDNGYHSYVKELPTLILNKQRHDIRYGK